MTSHGLAHAFWIGGSPGAGMSTVAAAFAVRFGLTAYDRDDAFEVHERIVDPDRFPTLYRLSRLTWNDLWTRPANRPGFARLPWLLHELGIAVEGAIWIVASPAFQREHEARRAWVAGILARCDDPGQARQDWMARRRPTRSRTG